MKNGRERARPDVITQSDEALTAENIMGMTLKTTHRAIIQKKKKKKKSRGGEDLPNCITGISEQTGLSQEPKKTGKRMYRLERAKERNKESRETGSWKQQELLQLKGSRDKSFRGEGEPSPWAAGESSDARGDIVVTKWSDI